MRDTKDTVDTVEGLVRAVCRTSVEPGDMAAAVMREHRTHQQIFAAFILSVISRWADRYKSKTYDLRNEETCRLSAEIVARMAADWPTAERLPYI